RQGAQHLRPPTCSCLRPPRPLPILEAVEDGGDERMITDKYSASHRVSSGIAHSKSVDACRVVVRQIASERFSGVEIAKTRRLCQLNVVRIEIALWPAEMLGNVSEPGLQHLARCLKFFGHMFVLASFFRPQVPTRVRMRVTMKLKHPISAHRLDFAPAQHHLV